MNYKKSTFLAVVTLIVIIIISISYIYMNPKNENQAAGVVGATYRINKDTVTEAQFLEFKKTLTISPTQSGEKEGQDGTISIYTATDKNGAKYTYSEGSRAGDLVYYITSISN